MLGALEGKETSREDIRELFGLRRSDGGRIDDGSMVPEGECKTMRGHHQADSSAWVATGGKTSRSIFEGRRRSRQSVATATVRGSNSEGHHNSARGRARHEHPLKRRASACREAVAKVWLAIRCRVFSEEVPGDRKSVV